MKGIGLSATTCNKRLAVSRRCQFSGLAIWYQYGIRGEVTGGPYEPTVVLVDCAGEQEPAKSSCVLPGRSAGEGLSV